MLIEPWKRPKLPQIVLCDGVPTVVRPLMLALPVGQPRRPYRRLAALLIGVAALGATCIAKNDVARLFGHVCPIGGTDWVTAGSEG